MVQKYAGALDENADGFDKELYEKGRRNYVGDQGEAEFLDWMRNSNIGGILIGDVNSQHLLYGHQLSDSDKEYYMLPSQVTGRNKFFHPFLSSNSFQFDFLYFNSRIGLIHIEVKTGRISGEEIIGKYSEQIMKQRKRLEELFEIFCQCIGEEKCAAKWSEFFSAPSVLVNLNDQNVETTEYNCKEYTIVYNTDQFKEFLTRSSIKEPRFDSSGIQQYRQKAKENEPKIF